MSQPVLLLSETAPSHWQVDEIAGVPATLPVLIVLVAGSDDARADVVALRERILDVLGRSAHDVRVTSGAPIAGIDPSAWPPLHDARRAKVLALVSSSSYAVKRRRWFSWWTQPGTDRAVLPLFQSDADPSSLLPPSLRPINACFWKTSVTECIPAIFRRVGLTAGDQRIFISYRRVETQPLAEQLFDALTHDGFDVFVDRFSVDPGVDFQQRLDQELADKSMVLFLESKNIRASKWTQHEIDYTKRFRLGMLALQLPGAAPVRTIDADARHKLEPRHFAGAPKRRPVGGQGSVLQWGALKPARLREIVALVKSTHDAAIWRRRQYVRSAMDAALAAAKVPTESTAGDGLITVRGARGARYAIWLTTRPPELADFHSTEPRTAKPPSKGVIVGPTALLEAGRHAQLDWLTGVCRFACIDEDDISDAAVRMSAGTL